MSYQLSATQIQQSESASPATLGASYGKRGPGAYGTQLRRRAVSITSRPVWATLKAIVLPVCSGKTTLANVFGGYDIDDVVADSSLLKSDTELEEMLNLRWEGMVLDSRAAMLKSNEMFLNRAARFFELVDPDCNMRVLYLHTAEMANALGVEVIGSFALPEEVVAQACRRRHQHDDNGEAMLRASLEQAAANKAYAIRHGQVAQRAVCSYDVLLSRVEGVLRANACFVSDGEAEGYLSKAKRIQGEKERLDLAWRELKSGTNDWVKAAAARAVRLSMLDAAPKEAHAAHNHPIWARVVHAVHSAAAPVNTASWRTRSEEQWRQHHAFGPGSGAFAFCNISDWLAHTPESHLQDPERYQWFKQLIQLGDVKYERALCTLVFDDVLDYVIPQHAKMAYRLRLGAVSDVHYVEIAKEIHNGVTLGCNYLGVPLETRMLGFFMYFDCLAGRLFGDQNLDEEVADRTGPEDVKRYFANGRWSTAEFDRRFGEAVSDSYSCIAATLSSSVRRLAEHVDDFDDFLRYRRTWVRPGAASGAPKADVYLKVPKDRLDDGEEIAAELGDMVVMVLKRVRLNESALFEFPEFVNMVKDALRDYVPNSYTRMFWKHEPGKPVARALYPANLLHYVVVSYVLHLAEKGGEIPGTRLNAGGDAQRVDHWLWRETHNFSLRLMLDYTNFNETHTVPHMQQVMLGLKESYLRTNALSSDLRWAIDWVCESFQKIVFEYEGQEVLFGHGLLSGWRCTTWINSIANRAYLQVIGQQVMSITGQPTFHTFQSGGDDVAAQAEDLYYACVIMRVGMAMGFTFKAVKQMLGQRYSEFYRLIIAPEGVFGSLPRMLGSALSGQWSNSVIAKMVEPAAKLNSVIEIARKAGRRSQLNMAFMEKMAVVAFDKWATDEEAKLAHEYIHGTKETGGLGIPTVHGDVYELYGTREPDVEMTIIGVPDDASRFAADRLVAEAADIVGAENVVPASRLAQKMAQGAFQGAVTQNLGLKMGKLTRNVRKNKRLRVINVKQIRASEFPGATSSMYAAMSETLRIKKQRLSRAGRRYDQLSEAVNHRSRLKLASQIAEECMCDYRLLFFWKEELTMYGCSTYLLTEDYYEDIMLLSLLMASELTSEHVSRVAASLAVGISNDGYMYY
ncbi:viral RNA-directed RNA-polymerase-domain-containing protein [Aspergillus coremiiformis]|uniref:Viral RNA-directed RNA-polymerase-domain-containing protein n=1 Tax=Aspergillus coremiiformis TaxID=138285 RepID=A0A5N6YUK0_9EURO|nr:viral RNA-directed RNA-polymerase-domain-containing protein [Aspergillus coremiiformis]